VTLPYPRVTQDCQRVQTEGEMSASSGEKRRRKRERQFLELYDRVSIHATFAGVGGSIALLVWIATRSMFIGHAGGG
jgi:hypothetical protein